MHIHEVIALIKDKKQSVISLLLRRFLHCIRAYLLTFCLIFRIHNLLFHCDLVYYELIISLYFDTALGCTENTWYIIRSYLYRDTIVWIRYLMEKINLKPRMEITFLRIKDINMIFSKSKEVRWKFLITNEKDKNIHDSKAM